jgi:hypothetical protein
MNCAPRARERRSALMATGFAVEVKGMSVTFPDAPASLPGAPSAFYDELRRMLAVVRPPRLSPDGMSVEFVGKGIEVAFTHPDRHDWDIWATVGELDAIVATSYTHEHFSARAHKRPEERPWTTEIVDFIAELLRGEIEVVTTFRGTTAISVEHFGVGEHGERTLLGHTGFLTPARLLLWRPKRTQTERISWQ